MTKRVQDRQPYIEVKDAILARSGIYLYTYDEVIAKGHTPSVKKPLYREMRPADVIIAAKELFAFAGVTKEHIDGEINENTFAQYASGVVGDSIEVVDLDDEKALKGKIAFYTKDAHEYYENGNRETSADYTSKSILVDNPDEVGYDLLMTEILSVNGVAITARGRGGRNVRVMDSAPVDVINHMTGRTGMGFLGIFLGQGKKKEEFAAQVRDSIVRAKGMDDAGRAKELEGVLSQVSGFTESANKQALIGVVRDSFAYTDAALDKWKESSAMLGGLYARCLDAEADAAKQVMDAEGGDDEAAKKKKDDEEKEAKAKDATAKAAEAAASGTIKDSAKLVEEAITALTEKIPGMIDAGIEKALHFKPGAEKQSRSTDSLSTEEVDVSGIMSGIFGER